MTYDSLRELPDFSGGWYIALDTISSLPAPPLKPEAATQLRGWRAQVKAGRDPADLGLKRSYCQPRRFTGFNSGLQDYFEILFTPGRVTITNELGLIRRIPIDPRPLAADLPESNTGTSVAHWEGRALVIETSGLKHDALYETPFTSYAPIRIGRGVHITERIALKERDVLEIDTRVIAPEVQDKPFDMVTLYRRERWHVFHEIDDCADNRSFDNVTGRERFDLTPPADLPPPPSAPPQR